MRELTEVELGAVSGGGFSSVPSFPSTGGFALLFASPVTQNNITTQVNAGVLAGGSVYNYNKTKQRIDIA
jgi:hypothetical protein